MTTLTLLRLSLAIIIPFSAGYSFILFLLKGQWLPVSFKLGCSYGIGLGLVAFWMFFLEVVHVTYSFLTIGVPLLIFSISCLLASFYRNSSPRQIYRPENSCNTTRLSSLHYILVLFITINLFYVFWRAMSMPVTAYDALATIAYKAKVIFYMQTLPDLNFLPRSSYPLMVPFNQAWIGYCLNEWSDININILFPLALLAFILIQYNFLKYFSSRGWAIIGIALLLSSNLLVFHATISYRDLLLMYFNVSTIFLIILWLDTRLNALLWVASLFAGFATFTKLEGSAYLLLYYGIFLLSYVLFEDSPRKTKLVSTLKFIVPSFTMCFSYHLYKICSLLAVNRAAAIEKMEFEFYWNKIFLSQELLSRFIHNLFFTNNWNLVWFVFMISLIYLPQKIHRREVRVLLLSLFFFFAFYAAYAMFSTYYIWIGGEKSSAGLSRLFLHFFPLAAVLIALLNDNSTSRETPRS